MHEQDRLRQEFCPARFTNVLSMSSDLSSVFLENMWGAGKRGSRKMPFTQVLGLQVL